MFYSEEPLIKNNHTVPVIVSLFIKQYMLNYFSERVICKLSAMKRGDFSDFIRKCKTDVEQYALFISITHIYYLTKVYTSLFINTYNYHKHMNI